MTVDVSRRSFLKLTSLSLAGWAVAPSIGALPRMAFAPEGVEPGGDVLVCRRNGGNVHFHRRQRLRGLLRQPGEL